MPAEASRARVAWLLLTGPLADELSAALEARGWRVARRFSSPDLVLAALEGPAARPDLLITGLQFEQGDSLQLIRRMGAIAQAPSVFVMSHAQRSVIKAAVALAQVARVRLDGWAELPMALDALADRIAAVPTRADSKVARAVVPLPISPKFTHELIREGRIEAWVQPKMRIASAEIVGFESLMRARDADGRLVMPDRLVPALDRDGLLDAATLLMLQQTVDMVRRALEAGWGISGSVNVSLLSLSDPQFCQELHRIVTTAGIDPSWVTIEITESDAMADPLLVIENTARIRMYGFGLAMDDFGTAYASLVRVTQLPFSELKIERAFVTDIHLDPHKQAIVRTCMRLGDALNLHVVAEGVETPLELGFLREIRCTEAQGYLVARPMPIPQAMRWLASLSDLRFSVPEIVR